MKWSFFAWEIPFKIAFKHNSAERSKAATVLVHLQFNGISAWGESCPREYVTGESVDSCLAVLKEMQSDLELTSFSDLQSWFDFKKSWSSQLDANLAATCALEMAVLDYLSKKEKISIEKLIGAEFSSGPFQYSAIIGDVKEPVWDEQFAWHKALDMLDYKLKLNGDIAIDNRRLGKIYRLLPNASIRLDANNKWDSISEVLDYLNALEYPIHGIEEPLKHGSFKSLNELASQINIKIILDEHACRKSDLERIVDPSKFIINVRVSKCGGIMNTLEMVEYAIKRGFQIIIGAQVGESSLLTRAATVVVNAMSQPPIAQEGAYGTNLLQNDIVAAVLQFDKQGQLYLPATSASNGIGDVIWNESAS